MFERNTVDMGSKYDVIRTRVNGSLLPNYWGKNVCLLGTVLQMDNASNLLKLKTSDNNVVSVRMLTPFRDYIDGVVEVNGVVNVNNNIDCDYYTAYSKESTQNFDMALYDEAVMLATNPKYYITN